jgi:hypothetical protein
MARRRRDPVAAARMAKPQRSWRFSPAPMGAMRAWCGAAARAAWRRTCSPAHRCRPTGAPGWASIWAPSPWSRCSSRAHLMSDRLALAGLCWRSAPCCRVTLPEREPHPALWAATMPLLDDSAPDWPSAYLRWELRLLEDELGYRPRPFVLRGRPGQTRRTWPSSARAPAARSAGQGAGDWADRLLPLPPGLDGTERPWMPRRWRRAWADRPFPEPRELADAASRPPAARGPRPPAGPSVRQP